MTNAKERKRVKTTGLGKKVTQNLGLSVIIGIVILVALIVMLDFAFSSSRWRGWQMMESVGTVLAVFAAILLAWWEGSKETRRETQQAQAIRILLGMEIDSNLDQLDSLRRSEMSLPDSNAQAADIQNHERFLERFVERPIEIRCQIKDRLLEQLELLSKALGPTDVIQLVRFYDNLDEVRRQQERWGNIWTGLSEQIKRSPEEFASVLAEEDNTLTFAILIGVFEGSLVRASFYGEQLRNELSKRV